jgi:hypothetical protein
MATVNVLVVVDVEGTTTSGSLANNVWMIDTGKYLGTQEAGNELVTLLNSGDEVVWAITAVNPGDNLTWGVGLTNNQPFSGTAVPANINPKPDPVETKQYDAIFTVPGGTAANSQYQYTMTLAMDGKNYSFDPFLKLYTAT